MSTVAQYKGSIIADISHAYIDDAYSSKYLSTANTYCEDNITFTNYNPDRSDLCQPKDVDFIDFDGRLLYSYTKAQFLALSAMPANPSYPHLIAQGWNWTLADAKTFVTQYGALVIGQNYTTDSGKTRIYITIRQDLVDGGISTIPLYINLPASPAANFDINWGDGTTSNGLTAGTNSNPQATHKHTYTKGGDYVIEITVNTGSIRLGYWGSTYTIVGGNWEHKMSVTRVEIGNGVIGLCRQAFSSFPNLEYISIPTTCCKDNDTGSTDMISGHILKGIVFPSGAIGQDVNVVSTTSNPYCYASLRYISIPKTMTGFKISESHPYSLRKLIFPNYTTSTTLTLVMTTAYSLTHYIVPGTYTTYASNVGCRSSLIKKLTIPASVTTIGASAFQDNKCLAEVHMLPTTPPSLASSSFNGCSSLSVIYVPYSSNHSVLNAYKTATNWSSFASKMQEES